MILKVISIKRDRVGARGVGGDIWWSDALSFLSQLACVYLHDMSVPDLGFLLLLRPPPHHQKGWDTKKKDRMSVEINPNAL